MQEAFVQWVSARKIDELAKKLGIENQLHIQVSEMTKMLNEQVQSFVGRPLGELLYPMLGIDPLYEKVRFGDRAVSMAILNVCGVNTLANAKCWPSN